MGVNVNINLHAAAQTEITTLIEIETATTTSRNHTFPSSSFLLYVCDNAITIKECWVEIFIFSIWQNGPILR